MLPVWRRLAPRTMVVGVVVAALSVPLALGAPAGASPQDDLEHERATAEQLEAKIDDLNQRISMLDENYNEGQLEISQTTANIEDAQHRIDDAVARSDGLSARLRNRAALLYVQASDTTPIDALEAANVHEIGSRSKYGAAAAEQDATLIDDLSVARQDLADQQAALEQQRKDAETKQSELQQLRDQMSDAQSQQEELLGQAQGRIAGLVAEIEAQRRAEEEARAKAELEKKQREEAAAKAAAAAATTAGTRGTSSTSAKKSAAVNAPDPGSRAVASSPNAQAAVDAAYGELGKPYRYAGDGPENFDCSGLTMFAWAAAGVSLPHSSRAQYAALPHVSIDALEPGDLVFYGNPIHHVGIYIGNGQYIHAPQTGDIVKISGIYRDDYTGGARPG
ncbi:MAG TPA: NlpC/P60 family protein [Acidimicrobiia bacterium]|nr:NlpC/P60 family protein [Acidimicrobiia bacterium]